MAIPKVFAFTIFIRLHVNLKVPLLSGSPKKIGTLSNKNTSFLSLWPDLQSLMHCRSFVIAGSPKPDALPFFRYCRISKT
jgi:hypothetical protein